CDSVLALGFGYNSQPVDNNYAGYNLPPPSAGYILLAGPAVDGSVGDSAIVDFERVYEKRNLPMSSFAYLSTGTAGSTDPQFIDYDLGSGQWWKLLRGYRPLGTFDSADVSYPTPLGLPATRFPLSGDPTSQSGFIDGQGTSYSLAPYDRRVLVNSGPVRLAPGDTAGVIMGFAVGMGSDFLSSVSAMKAMVRVAHEATQELFAHPRGPLRPRVTAIELNKEIVLSWGDDQELVDAIEYMDAPGGYAFEGYVVYQLPWESAPLSEGIKLATFDVMNGVTVIRNNVFPLNQEIVQEGTDSGIYRSLRVRADELENTRILYNGRKYYFAVTAYNYTPDETREIRSYESEPARIQAIPQIPFGILPPTSSGDSLAIERLSGNSTGTISAVVVDPTRPGGDTYELRFDTAAGRTTMEVWNSSRSILAGSSDLAGMPYVASLTADGVEVQARHVDEFLRFEVTANGAGLLDPPEQGCFAFNSNGFPFLDGADRPTERQQVGTGYWGIHTGMTGANDGTFSSFTVQVTENGSLWPVISPGDYEIRFTASGGVGFAPSAYTTGGDTGGVVLNVPFELWNIGSGMSNDPSDDVRLFPYLLDIMGDGIFNLAPIDHVVSGASNDPETDWFFWVVPADQSPGQSGYEEIAAEVMTNGVNHVYLGPLTAGTEVLRRMVLVNWNGGDVQD
ncbi:MAG: hypothetical protein IH628_13915, partial [Proteobacteria bacterium]|nr:hypothetical protein [Pseudomonadota bacterium]